MGWHGLLMCGCAVVATMAGCGAGRQPIHLEAESGMLRHVITATTRPGFSGQGYVTGFRTDEDRLAMSCPSPGGLYDMTIRYSCPGGPKGYVLEVNGFRSSGTFAGTGEEFASHRVGLVELLKGENALSIYGGWHYYDIDCVDLVPAETPRPPAKPPKNVVDPDATAKTKSLMSYLVDQYGKATLSGVYCQDDVKLVESTTGKTPAIFGADLMDFSPSRVERGARADGLMEQLIEQAKSGHIVTISWHWNAPKDLVDKELTTPEGNRIDARWWKGFNTNATTFDIEKALANPDSEDYRLLLRDIDAIADQLKKLADADVPVLWRPLHEAEGKWFWWGAKGPKPFVQLWKLMYDRLTRKHQLHNLIWVYTGTASREWYPGDQYVDVVGIDAYPLDRRETFSGMWEELQQAFGGRKLVAISEYGAVPDIARMERFGVHWAYFVTWVQCVKNTPNSEIGAIYHLPTVLNRDRVCGR